MQRLSHELTLWKITIPEKWPVHWHWHTWSLGDGEANERRVSRSVGCRGGDRMSWFFLLLRRWWSALVPLNVIGHFAGCGAVVRMHIRRAFRWFSRHLSRPTQKQHVILSSCVKTTLHTCAICRLFPTRVDWVESLHWHCFSRRAINWFWELIMEVRAPYFFSSSL